MNKVFLIGNTTKDVEISKTKNDMVIGKFTLAVSRKYTNEEGKKDVDFLPVTVWNKTAEACQKYLTKGSKVAVVGEVRISSFENGDGKKEYYTNIVATEVEFLSQRRTEDEKQDKHTPLEDLKPADDSDLPF